MNHDQNLWLSGRSDIRCSGREVEDRHTEAFIQADITLQPASSADAEYHSAHTDSSIEGTRGGWLDMFAEVTTCIILDVDCILKKC